MQRSLIVLISLTCGCGKATPTTSPATLQPTNVARRFEPANAPYQQLPRLLLSILQFLQHQSR